MKPAPFRYFTPSTVPEALQMLGEHAPQARPLAGGQSLVPMMNFRLAHPAVLIDLNGIADLACIRDVGRHIAIGAMARERAIETSALIGQHAPLLQQATRHIAHQPIRSRGTIGGSIAHADPAAEYPAAVLALDAELVARSTRGERRIPAAQFFAGVMTTALAPDELLVEIVVPKAPPQSGSAFVEIARRHGDFALVGIAAQITVEGARVTAARLAACGVGARATRLAQAERAITGKEVSPATLAAAGVAAAAEIEPESDLHAGAGYRRRLARVLVGRALAQAVDNVKQSA